MPLKVSFEISEQDLRHFRKEMRRAREAIRIADDDDIIAAARDTMARLDSTAVPHFVRERLDKLEALVEMINDTDWMLGRKECDKVLSALVYFGEPDDLIPDDIPGLGFLDDAIMIELVLKELRHEIEAYRDFCEFRDSYAKRFKKNAPGDRERRLRQKRDSLFERMHRRQQAES